MAKMIHLNTVFDTNICLFIESLSIVCEQDHEFLRREKILDFLLS